MRDVTIPALGMAMTEAVLTRWRKQPGDSVTAGEVVAEIETDKSNVDLESPAQGVLGRHLVGEGDVVPVGAAVAQVLAPGESEASLPSAGESIEPPAAAQDDPARSAARPPDAAAATADVASPVEPAVPPVPAQLPAVPAPDAPRVPAALPRYEPPPRTPHRLSPRKRRLERLEAEAQAFTAIAAEGGPTQARESAPPPRATPPARVSGRYRAAIADGVSRSWREIPHFAVQREIDAGEADSVLAAVRARDPDATWTDLLLRAFALALAEVPANSDGPASGDVGLAVATPDGILMPVVAAVPGLDVPGLVTRRVAAVRRAREGRLSPSDLTATPVGTLSNLGSRGVDAFTGIIPLQQQLLLTVGRVAARPVVVDGRLAVRTTLVATLNVDHRALDGDHAARVLLAFDRELGALRGWAEGAPR